MHLAACLCIASILASASAYPWGTNACGPPGHGGASSTDANGLSIKMDGSRVVLSSTRGGFRGFYLKSSQDLEWTDPPPGASGSNVCGGAKRTVLHHSNSNSKAAIAANIACTPGQPLSIAAYVVFSYSSAYVSFTSQVVCGNGTGSAPAAVLSDALPVIPAYLSHGIIFIVTFSVLMPVTSVLMLINKAKFYHVHQVLGFIISVLIAVGGFILIRAEPSDPNYASLAFVNVGKDHKKLGLIGIIAASIVCCLGVTLWTRRLPSSVKPAVRYCHGILGCIVSLFGPFVVWTGWIRLAPVVSRALDQTPLVWMSLAITGVVVVAINRFLKLKASPATAFSNIISQQQIKDFIAAGKIIVLYHGAVCVVPPSFSHPGGRSVFQTYIGQEIGDVMLGKAQAQLGSSKRRVLHSPHALQLVQEMSIGRIQGGDEEMGILTPNHPQPSAPPLSIIQDTVVFKRSVQAPQDFPAQIVSCTQINTAADFPVLHYKLQLTSAKHWTAFTHDSGAEDGSLVAGCRVYLKLPDDNSLQRPYTSIHADARTRTVEFAIKHYALGSFTSRLSKLSPGAMITISGAVTPALPPLQPHPRAMVMIAGGTGVTPMLGYARHCRTFALGGVLLWWIRNSSDFFCGSLLASLRKDGPLDVKVFYTRESDGPASSSLLHDDAQALSSLSVSANGRITRESIVEGLGQQLREKMDELVYLISGPPGFVSTANAALEDAGVRGDRIVCLD